MYDFFIFIFLVFRNVLYTIFAVTTVVVVAVVRFNNVIKHLLDALTFQMRLTHLVYLFCCFFIRGLRLCCKP